MASLDPTPLISELARLLSRELMLNVPREEFAALTDAAKVLREAVEFLGPRAPDGARHFLREFNKFSKIAD